MWVYPFPTDFFYNFSGNEVPLNKSSWGTADFSAFNSHPSMQQEKWDKDTQQFYTL
jgi:hypothetical protein